jgi:dUTP pyrophosphatase
MFNLIRPEAVMPTYATTGSAGMDVFAAITGPVTINPGERSLIPTGLVLQDDQLSDWEEIQCRSKSGLALKHGIMVLNSPGTIDSDYRGEIAVILQNFGNVPFTVEKHMKIAQLVVCSILRAISIDTAEVSRGQGGFGSTGK